MTRLWAAHVKLSLACRGSVCGGGQGQLRVTTLSIMGKQGGLSAPQGDCQRLTAPPLGQLSNEGEGRGLLAGVCAGVKGWEAERGKEQCKGGKEGGGIL